MVQPVSKEAAATARQASKRTAEKAFYAALPLAPGHEFYSTQSERLVARPVYHGRHGHHLSNNAAISLQTGARPMQLAECQ